MQLEENPDFDCQKPNSLNKHIKEVNIFFLNFFLIYIVFLLFLMNFHNLSDC